MASRTVAAMICAFAPCSGFLGPVQLAGPSAGAPSLHAPSKTAAAPAAARSCRVLSSRHGGGNGAGTFASQPRVGRRLPYRTSSVGRLAMMMMAAAGEGGGCEMEGEVVGDGAESAPVARTEDEGARDAGGTEADQSAPVTASSEGQGGGVRSSINSASSSVPGSGGPVGEVGGRGIVGRRREAPLTEREGFAMVKKVLPGGGEGLEMDLEGLRDMRSNVNKIKRSMRRAVEEEDYKTAGDLRNEMSAIRAKDPLYVVSDLLGVAVSKEKFKRAARLRDAKDWILRESRGSVFEVDRLVCLGDKASNIITTDPEGATVRRFLRNDQVAEISRTGQIQLPVWSPDGKMVAFSVLKAGSGGAPIESAKILVYRESGSLVLDVGVPRAPFLLMWSPSSQSLTYLSNSEGPGGATIRLSEILVAAAKTPYRTKTRGLAQGNPLFYAYTKKDSRNADMVVHTANRVYHLDMTTGDEVDISTRAAQLFMAPSTHCEGGEDAVILVETDGDESGQHLVSARVDGSAKKRICPTRGFSTFGVSPDGQRLCLMQQDMTTGFYTISVLEGGEGALDPLSTATMEQVEMPLDRVIMAFFFSPDSTKLLCLATKMSKSELAVARSSMRLGFQLKFQWVIYDCETRDVQLLEEFSPRPFFLKMYLPYFDMFAQGFTPWAPDSKSFSYVSAEASFVQEVPDDGLAPLPRELGPNMEFVSWSFC
ncbi:unnamed protein product [Ectocarpus sp. 6 AP-2014]